MIKHLFPLLLLLAGCGNKKQDPGPAAPPAVERLLYTGDYSMVSLESVHPTISLALSATPSAYWINTLDTVEPYYSSSVPFPSYQYSTVAGETLTLTIRVPNMPVNLKSNADFYATVHFADQYRSVFMDYAYLSNPANYGPKGAIITASITRR